MKKTIIVILFSLAMPLTSFAQINYGVVVAAGTSKMETAHSHENWGELLSGWLFLRYSDKNNLVYETGIYYNYRNLKLDRFSKEYVTDVDWIRYHINDLKIPLAIGTKINSGIFTKLNLIIQGGMFFSYGISGDASIWNINSSGLTVFNTTERIFNKSEYTKDNQLFVYYPLKRFDTGILLKAGLKYQQFYFSLNSETGLVNLNSYYDSKIRSSSLYLSIAYNFAK